MAAGFSYREWTGLSMGGMTGNHAEIIEACTTNIDEMEAYDLLLSEGVNMEGTDPDIRNAGYAVVRITYVTAIDPGLAWGLTVANVVGLSPNVNMISFGGPNDRMNATNFDESCLKGLLSGAKMPRFDSSFHFTAMPWCTPAVETILIADNDDSVFTNPAGTNWAAVHSEIINIIADELGL